MFKVAMGQKLPNELIECLDGIDSLKLLTSSPMLGMACLNGISKEEVRTFEGTMEVAYVNIEGVPFLVIDFERTINFDVVIENLEAKAKEENALNLLFIENRNFNVVGQRMVGLDTRIIEALINDTKKLPYSGEILTAKAIEIQNRYTTLDLLKLATIRQVFKK